jgi:hypothetical protein
LALSISSRSAEPLEQIGDMSVVDRHLDIESPTAKESSTAKIYFDPGQIAGI